MLPLIFRPNPPPPIPCWPCAARSSPTCKPPGVAPYGTRFDTDGSVAQIRERFAEGATFRLAGRVTAHRDMGKSQFLDVSDLTGRIQWYVNLKNLSSEQTAIFHLIDLGDFVGIEGECFTTRTGEPTIRVSRFVPLSKALRPAARQASRPRGRGGTATGSVTLTSSPTRSRARRS